MGSRSLAGRVFVFMAAVCTAVAVVVTVVMFLVYETAAVADAQSELGAECHVVASMIDQGDDEVAALAALDLGTMRITLVEPDGTVAYDSTVDASTLPNHADRTEVAQALSTGEGSSERTSETVGYMSIYHAVRLPNGNVLRLSENRAGVIAIFSRNAYLVPLLVVGFIALSWFVSRLLARRLVRPVLAIDPSSGEGVSPYQELDTLVDRLNEQHAELVGRMEQIQDVDDMRREFTANVTHELKTPIASISAASELIRDGIARPEDVSGFAGRIYDDSQRLSSLVSDILTLSKLDESERAGDRALFGGLVTVDLLSIAQDVCERLTDKAAATGVSVVAEGISTKILGNARLLDELIGNLVENAIRYNKVGGKVFVWVLPEGGAPCVRVSDTGIGIPETDQPKVFERFYRVDKGRSRDTGGTGLGLAIVKHAAAFHGATVRLWSKVGEGTSVSVTFPKE